MKKRSKSAESPSELIDARIEELGDWRGDMLSRLRALIKEADPDSRELGGSYDDTLYFRTRHAQGERSPNRTATKHSLRP